MSIYTVAENIRFIGVNDPDLDKFEGQFPIPNGMAYNSYVVMDEQIAVMDTADIRTIDAYLHNLAEALEGRKPTYLVVQHVEPDHASGFGRFLEQYPDTKIVGNAQTFRLLGNYFSVPEEQKVTVKDGDTLSLGKHTLQFLFAPQVHWPEVMVTYEQKTGTLFSADAFGTYGTVDPADLFHAGDWAEEAGRYYFNIVGRFGPNVQKLLGKVADLTRAGQPIARICALHGPVLSEKTDIQRAIALYDKWSRYEPDRQGIFIAYCTMHGNMKKAAETLAELLEQKGCPHVELCDLNRTDLSYSTTAAFRYGTMVLMAPTYYGNVIPGMVDFLYHIGEKKFRNRTVGLVEEGTWGPCSAKAMARLLEPMEGIVIAEPKPKFLGAFRPEYAAQLEELADALLK